MNDGTRYTLCKDIKYVYWHILHHWHKAHTQTLYLYLFTVILQTWDNDICKT